LGYCLSRPTFSPVGFVVATGLGLEIGDLIGGYHCRFAV